MQRRSSSFTVPWRTWIRSNDRSRARFPSRARMPSASDEVGRGQDTRWVSRRSDLGPFGQHHPDDPRVPTARELPVPTVLGRAVRPDVGALIDAEWETVSVCLTSLVTRHTDNQAGARDRDDTRLPRSVTRRGPDWIRSDESSPCHGSRSSSAEHSDAPLCRATRPWEFSPLTGDKIIVPIGLGRRRAADQTPVGQG